MSISNKPEVIGVAGSFASGKDTVAHYLEEKYGYTHVSTGDTVREYAMKERGSTERPVLREVANALRHEKGAGIFVEYALKEARPIVVTGIRSLGEAKAIKKAGGTLVFVDAAVEIRYERMKSRQRDSETELTLQEFQANEQKEWYSGESDADFNLRDIQKIADVTLHNDADLAGFLHSIDKKLHLL